MHNYEVVKISKEIITQYKFKYSGKTNEQLQKSQRQFKLKKESMKTISIKKITSNVDKLKTKKYENNLEQLESYFI